MINLLGSIAHETQKLERKRSHCPSWRKPTRQSIGLLEFIGKDLARFSLSCFLFCALSLAPYLSFASSFTSHQRRYQCCIIMHALCLLLLCSVKDLANREESVMPRRSTKIKKKMIYQSVKVNIVSFSACSYKPMKCVKTFSFRMYDCTRVWRQYTQYRVMSGRVQRRAKSSALIHLLGGESL